MPIRPLNNEYNESYFLCRDPIHALFHSKVSTDQKYLKKIAKEHNDFYHDGRDSTLA